MKEISGSEYYDVGESLDDFLPTPRFIKDLCGPSQTRVFRGKTQEETLQVSPYNGYCVIVIGKGSFQWTIGIDDPPYFGNRRLMHVIESINSQVIYDYYLELPQPDSALRFPNVLNRKFSAVPVNQGLTLLSRLNSLRQDLGRLN